MNIRFDLSISEGYLSQSQIVRVLTEHWVRQNSFCPNCGCDNLEQFTNNKPVADFFCDICCQEYELKSKNGTLSGKIVDGAYNTMINRIESDNNPNFFFLTYNAKNWSVSNFLIIPKHYFTQDVIEKRKPLSDSARRAGWIGCNILLGKIPVAGQLFLVRNSVIIDKDLVLKKWRETEFVKNIDQKAKVWIIDILNCLDKIPNQVFKLEDVYQFEPFLRIKHPQNNFIKEKIRQQLQLLRDKGLLDFLSKGLYKKKLLS